MKVKHTIEISSSDLADFLREKLKIQAGTSISLKANTSGYSSDGNTKLNGLVIEYTDGESTSNTSLRETWDR